MLNHIMTDSAFENIFSYADASDESARCFSFRSLIVWCQLVKMGHPMPGVVVANSSSPPFSYIRAARSIQSEPSIQTHLRRAFSAAIFEDTLCAHTRRHAVRPFLPGAVEREGRIVAPRDLWQKCALVCLKTV